ncbi:ribosomal RNA 16S rRNA dimethylase [Thiobacillus denitrificans ATCC 25259]|uniref:Ribosomal RNA small subunit methyltransferase A n=1 Tax=Thiobacillus denitrificans (strain ATCC 25259 / T1) TaxID=292415 RepID=RSMA_THIDA|nr:16S rRNA (adenine(1518)-N(6)/adenine(1519)-N(6))-dimethyltransferase RsmA [Thiobacillus denitrificans]Q3SGF7.1 RecName: Full=Ribosomal RNA small subunit methyltransferase A; AltName: Full=16S rRNA (adenine(1518)-N(6)/adenine(1519)-N(6))-dimethyltransferase; AltName: Full=16S rRNA dimethyladenosine transferase; AltName: Full=16S rRNA dimethylase; AltName: Full=S-adenosylmethionine-6-N', N'-adenosyl(rRNA) dimethyltransferase [Thiobacillus denitrificans ATCC 25259]AAZ98293.1 ribosomal RNA 16S rRN
MHTPRKRFGQNFLIDDGIVHAIVNAIHPQAGETVVEIGPGLGALTRPLLERLPHLHAVELDRDIIARLRRAWPPERLTLHAGDALKFDFGSLGDDLRIVGNLPYNISTPLLFHLLEFAPRIRDMHFMLQKEVVERMVASPATADYGRLSIMLQRRFHMEWLLDVPPTAFDPPPKVESAVVRLIPKSTAEVPSVDEALFARVVAAAFAQRRKTLRNTLSALMRPEDFVALGIDPGLRAEALHVADYEAITAYLATR